MVVAAAAAGVGEREEALEDVEDLNDVGIAEGAAAAADPQLTRAEAAEGMAAGDERCPFVPHHAHAAHVQHHPSAALPLVRCHLFLRRRRCE